MALIRGFWRFLVGVKDGLALLFLLLILYAFYVAQQGSAPAKIPNNSALVLNLQGFIVDQAREPDPLALLSGAPAMPGEIETASVVRAIDRATGDKRIKSLVLDLDGFWGGGLANLQSIGEALSRFRAAKKPVYAFSSAYLDDGYYLAAYADEVWLNPLGAVLLSGPGGSNLYFKNALDKLAIDVNVFRVGTYKSAVEPFVRNEASDEARTANQTLVDALWETWLSDVDGKRSAADVRSYMSDLPPYLASANNDFAQAALKAGLIDKIGTRAGFEDMLTGKYGKGISDTPGDYNGIAFAQYTRGKSPAILGGDAVGIVYVSGEIIDGEAPSGMAGGKTISDLIMDALGNDDIKALVVRIDSPGGSVTASEQIREALSVAKSRGIPVVASFGPVAASGGYWIATAADEIYARPATITGSIGVFAVIPTFNRTLADFGINADGVKSTPYSGEPDVLKGLTPEVRSLLQASVENIYSRFTRLVGTARGLSIERVDEIGQGHVWDGGTAHQLNLVDHLGGLDDAVSAAAKRAGLDPDKVRTVDIKARPSLPLQVLNSMFGDESQETAPADAIARLTRMGQMRALSAISAAGSIAAGPSAQVRCVACIGVFAGPVTMPKKLPAWIDWFVAK